MDQISVKETERRLSDLLCLFPLVEVEDAVVPFVFSGLSIRPEARLQDPAEPVPESSSPVLNHLDWTDTGRSSLPHGGKLISERRPRCQGSASSSFTGS